MLREVNRSQVMGSKTMQRTAVVLVVLICCPLAANNSSAQPSDSERFVPLGNPITGRRIHWSKFSTPTVMESSQPRRSQGLLPSLKDSILTATANWIARNCVV